MLPDFTLIRGGGGGVKANLRIGKSNFHGSRISLLMGKELQTSGEKIALVFRWEFTLMAYETATGGFV